MADGKPGSPSLGWAGTGRMGFSLASRLLADGHDLTVYNRTRAKAEPLAEHGATIVDSPSELGSSEIVFTMVAGPDDFRELVLGSEGILSGGGAIPRVIVDMTTISVEASEEVRAGAAECGVDLLAAPVSGNPKVVDSGRLTFVVSGPRDAYDEVLPYLDILGASSSYVGAGDLARLAKICHNLLLGVVIEALAEIVVLAQKGGIARADLMSFINDSVMGSVFTRYKTPALVNLDFTPTFTSLLLRKDFDLGLDLASELGVEMPTTASAREAVQRMIDAGRTEEDFAALLEMVAEQAGLKLTPEGVAVDDGLVAAPGSPAASN